MTQTDIERGDHLLERGELAQAVTEYGKILDKQPDHPAAAPNYYALQYQLDHDAYWLRKLQRFAADHPENSRAAQWMTTLMPEGIAYVHFLPEPTEAMINLIKQLIDEGAKPPEGVFEITLSSLESPSARLAVERWIASVRPNSRLKVTFPLIKANDPRRPTAAIDPALVVWRYDEDNSPHPAMNPPTSPALEREISAIARQPFNMPAWKVSARAAGDRLGSDSTRGLMALMVNPPPAPDTFTEWEWIFHVQIAAALVIAQSSRSWEFPIEKKGIFGKSSQPAPRKQALFALLRGAMDWTVTAAILALTELALDEPEHDQEIARWLFALNVARPRQLPVPYYDALALCGLRLKSVSKRERGEYEKMLTED